MSVAQSLDEGLEGSKVLSPHVQALWGYHSHYVPEVVVGEGVVLMGDYDKGFEDGQNSVRDRMTRVAATLSNDAAYKVARMAGSVHPCEVEGCNLSQEEHHRLAYGILAENRELRRRIEEYEHGKKEKNDDE